MKLGRSNDAAIGGAAPRMHISEAPSIVLSCQKPICVFQTVRALEFMEDDMPGRAFRRQIPPHPGKNRHFFTGRQVFGDKPDIKSLGVLGR